jgi:hypothetical protein
MFFRWVAGNVGAQLGRGVRCHIAKPGSVFIVVGSNAQWCSSS